MTSERDLKLPLLWVQALMPEFDLYLTVVPLGFFASYSLRAKLSIVELKKAYNKFRLEVELFIVLRRVATSTPVESFVESFPSSTTLSKGWFKKQFVL